MSMPTDSRERVIGLDVGTHRIGVAVSDELQIIASPETTIIVAQREEGREEAISAIVALVRRYESRRVVVGLPMNMKGERGVQATWTEEFVAHLRAALSPLKVYISLIDERLTTTQATRSFDAEHGRSRSKQREKGGRSTLDARAAAFILQGYLDRRRNRRETSDP